MTGCRVGVRFVVEVARNSGGRICRAQSEGHACHARRIGKTPTIGGLFARPIKQSSILWGGFHQTIGFLRQSLAVPLP